MTNQYSNKNRVNTSYGWSIIMSPKVSEGLRNWIVLKACQIVKHCLQKKTESVEIFLQYSCNPNKFTTHLQPGVRPSQFIRRKATIPVLWIVARNKKIHIYARVIDKSIRTYSRRELSTHSFSKFEISYAYHPRKQTIDGIIKSIGFQWNANNFLRNLWHQQWGLMERANCNSFKTWKYYSNDALDTNRL
jgi:hypothetical protein